jgi:hypothetical protein
MSCAVFTDFIFRPNLEQKTVNKIVFSPVILGVLTPLGQRGVFQTRAGPVKNAVLDSPSDHDTCKTDHNTNLQARCSGNSFVFSAN